ncbi:MULTISPECIES: hypothetical protein [unclassified Pseudovibrio]|uniref:hypothetical protein n=1 Tax=unclassified Pseudovibrio TaxID=2627060 RepID=UPI0007AE98B2|nr:MULTISPECIES: hypothetical protein [unclassified Pseudovibrio]KZK92595.1 hypothetical protein PsW74_05522 [Pseudovibrio sp. W74]KZL10364.1 hypothetical protein PsAD14_01271 [Pseudovibrio sp. Ad14]
MDKLSSSANARLLALCNLFGIRKEAIEENEDFALAILVNLYAMPVIPDKSERRQYGNEILQNAHSAFPPPQGNMTSEFHGGVASQVIMMQEFPAWYAKLDKSPAELVVIYKDLETTVSWLEYAGIGVGALGGTSAFKAGVIEGINTGSIREGMKKAGKRFMGQDALTDALKKRLGQHAPKLARAGGVIGAIVIASAVVAYHAAKEQMEEIKSIMMIKYQNGEATHEQFSAVFADGVDPEYLNQYWEH